MTARRRVCALSELAPGTVRGVDVDGRRVCIAHCASGIFAIDDICSHEDYNLSDGEIDADACEIECWAHGSVFSLVTGEPQNLPATRPVATYRVEVDGDDVHVVLP